MVFNIKWLKELRLTTKQCKHEKSPKHASVACGQLLRKLWTFLDPQQIFGSLYASMATNLHYLSTINLFLLKNIQCFGKYWNKCHFLWLGDTKIYGHLSIQKMGLQTKFNFFHLFSSLKNKKIWIFCRFLIGCLAAVSRITSWKLHVNNSISIRSFQIFLYLICLLRTTRFPHIQQYNN